MSVLVTLFFSRILNLENFENSEFCVNSAFVVSHKHTPELTDSFGSGLFSERLAFGEQGISGPDILENQLTRNCYVRCLFMASRALHSTAAYNFRSTPRFSC